MSEPQIIDLTLAGVDADGANLYMPPLEAASYTLGRFCCEYPREAGGIMAFGLWGATFAYFVGQLSKPNKKRSKKREPKRGRA
jgi:hypothetical protein